MVTRPSVSLAFLSTPSARRATLAHNYESGLNGFLSTPSARRATYLLTVPPTSIKISIHALREEGDDVGVDDVVHIARFLSTPSARRATRASSTATSTCSYFYPRPPRGGRLSPSCVYALHWKFLSTPSARRATRSFSASISNWRYFYPRPPRGGRHGQRLHEGAGAQISIHALREEGDLYAPRTKLQHLYFYPRPPRGGRPHNAGDGAVHVLISIYALREEGDDVRAGLFCSYGRFLSTPSARRATPADLRG